MRLFLWSHHPLIEIWNRNDGSLARHGTGTGDLRVMSLRPFPEPAVELFIEIPMAASFSKIIKIIYGYDFKSH